MTDSDPYRKSLAESHAISRPALVWTAASGKFTIHLTAEVINRLGIEARSAFNRVPRRGLEIGGILLGRTEIAGDLTTCWIEGFQAIESEHRSGPSYLLSEADVVHVEEALAKHHDAMVGIYRTQTRSEELQLEEPDLKLFEQCFAGKDAIFLLIKPVSEVAAFFIPSDGTLKCAHEFPFRPDQTARREEPRTHISGSPHAQARQLTQRTPAGAGGLAEFLERRSRFPRRWGGDRSTEFPEEIELARSKHNPLLAAAIVCALLALSLTAFWYFRRHEKVPSAAAHEHLSLNVVWEGESLRLFWDRNSPALRGVTHAFLRVRDGNHEKSVELAKSELQTGSILYKPEAPDVTFRVEVYSADPSAAESIRIISANATQSSATAPSPPLDPAPQPTVRPQPRPATPVHARSFPVESEVTRSSSPDRSGGDNVPAPIASAPIVRDTPATSELSAARGAPMVRETPIESDSKPEVSEIPAAASPGPDLPVSIVAEPVSGSRWGNVVGKIPLLRRLKKPSKVAAPAALHEVRPVLNPEDKRTLTKPVSIDVKVYVGESGAVKHAEVVQYGDPPNWSLANAALAAAQRWDFEPARIGDLAVSSEVILHFRFGRGEPANPQRP